MTITGWWRQTFWGDIHLTPVGDERMHTVPMCWCPIRIHRRPDGMCPRLFEHFTVQEVREGKHKGRGILK